jgi:hypothetical protein
MTAAVAIVEKVVTEGKDTAARDTVERLQAALTTSSPHQLNRAGLDRLQMRIAGGPDPCPLFSTCLNGHCW